MLIFCGLPETKLKYKGIIRGAKKIFKKNLDVLLATGFVLIGTVLFRQVKNTCKGAGCIFGFVLVLPVLLDSVIFSAVSVLRGKAEKNFVKVIISAVSILFLQ